MYIVATESYYIFSTLDQIAAFLFLLPFEILAIALAVVCLTVLHLYHTRITKKTQQVRKVLEDHSSNMQENEAYGLVLGRRAAHIPPIYEEVTGSADYERVDDFAHIPDNHEPANTSSLVQSRGPVYVNVAVDV